MRLLEAIDFLTPAFSEPIQGQWADIGAGTGLFTLALRHLMTSGSIIALDKSPHALWSLPLAERIPIEVAEGDFTKSLELPPLDGLVIANALHYATDPENVMQELVGHLKEAGQLLLIEYDTDRPQLPWIPYPIAAPRAESILHTAGMTSARLFNRKPSRYGPYDLYGLVARRA